MESKEVRRKINDATGIIWELEESLEDCSKIEGDLAVSLIGAIGQLKQYRALLNEMEIKK